MLHYYGYLGLEAELTPIINCLSKISNNTKNPDLRLPLKECGIISPLEVSAETVREFFRPEEYDLDRLQESIESFPGEFEGVEMEQIRELLFDKDELTVNP